MQRDEGPPQRGYSLPYHAIVETSDPGTMAAINSIVSHVYLNERSLDRATKELVAIAVLATIGATQDHIEAHVAIALDLGVDPIAVLEALELLATMCGLVAFSRGVVAWQSACENAQTSKPNVQ